MDLKTIGSNLSSARRRAHFTQERAAAELGITPAAISQYESGKRSIDALSLERLARLYGTAISQLMSDVEPLRDWEEAVRSRAAALSEDVQAAVSRVIGRIKDLAYLYEVTGTPYPGFQHKPFDPVAPGRQNEPTVRQLAARVRRHFDIGNAPLPDIRTFLEAHGCHVFALSLGTGDDALSGLFIGHPELGPVLVVNTDEYAARHSFTLAHQFAHQLFHHDRGAVLCRTNDKSAEEQFANQFAANFLMPEAAIQEFFSLHQITRVETPEQVVHLAAYFGVSFRAMRYRLQNIRSLALSDEQLDAVRPVRLSRQLGYETQSATNGLPRAFTELAYRAWEEQKLSLRHVAELLEISELELEMTIEGFDEDIEVEPGPAGVHA